MASLLEINLSSKTPFLAFLSACGTSQNLDDRTIDENIHLTNAFQLVGFRHVVGTLWEVDDGLCVDMARMTYEFLGEKGMSDAVISGGLHHATRALRDQWINNQSIGFVEKRTRDASLCEDAEMGMPPWVPYVHYGV